MALSAASTIFGAIAKREKRVASHVPYLRHVDERTICTADGVLMSIAKFTGFCFQTADQSQINARYAGRNTFVRALNDSRFACWSHIIRRETHAQIGGDFDNPFCAALDRTYMDGLHSQKMYVNEHYLSVLRRGFQGKVGVIDSLAKALRSASGIKAEAIDREARRELREVMNNLETEFSAYGAKVLEVEDRPDGVFSQPCEFLTQLLNGGIAWPRRLPRMGLDSYLPTARVTFGRKAMEFRGAAESETRFGAMISIREYPSYSGPGMLDGLLRINGEFIVSQSFAIEDRAPVLEEVARVERRIAGSDEAGTEVEDSIHIARNELTSGRTVLGKHHLTVLCLGKTIAAMERCVQDVTKELQNFGITVVREDLNAEPCFWAQLPGNFSYIARSARISSKNFVGFTSLHNFAVGKATGNRWGPALSVLQTTSATPYYFNFHRLQVGSFTWVGPTGSGKTVALLFMVCQMMRVHARPRVAFFDVDRGGEVAIWALGGRYEVLEPGVPTGFNPLQLPGSEADKKFVNDLLRFLVRPADGSELKAEQKRIIDDAVVQIFSIDMRDRKFSDVSMLLRGKERLGHDDMASRFELWLGSRGWLFNNPVDAWSAGTGIFGFDMTKILDDPELRTAALGYIFHRIEGLINGDPLAVVIDEGWKIAQDPVAAAFLIDKLKTIRKENGLVGFVTQSAKDIMSAKIAHTLLEQTPTNVFFPNPKADDDSYLNGFKLSLRELEWVRTTLPESRQFLIKHDQDSVIARLDLSHMPQFVKVLSGNEKLAIECAELRKLHGDDPKAWLPHFCGLEI